MLQSLYTAALEWLYLLHLILETLVNYDNRYETISGKADVYNSNIGQATYLVEKLLSRSVVPFDREVASTHVDFGCNIAGAMKRAAVNTSCGEGLHCNW